MFADFFPVHALTGVETDVELTDPYYEGESWVKVGDALRIVCQIPVQEPFALRWTKDDALLDLTTVDFVSGLRDKVDVAQQSYLYVILL